MPTRPPRTFALTPFPGTKEPAVRSIEGRVSRTSDGLQVDYVLTGDVARLCVPAPRAPRFADGLWRHTCFELFVARRGEPQYLEFNFSPSGEWAAYAFARYRERRAAGVEHTAAPRVVVRRSENGLQLDATVCLEDLAGSGMPVLGLSAVIEGDAGALSYWALRHPMQNPDFHHPDGFVLELDEIRN